MHGKNYCADSSTSITHFMSSFSLDEKFCVLGDGGGGGFIKMDEDGENKHYDCFSLLVKSHLFVL